MGLVELINHVSENSEKYVKHTVWWSFLSTVGGFAGGLVGGVLAAYYTGNAIYTSLAAMAGFFVTKEAIYLPAHLYAIYDFFFQTDKEKKEAVKKASPSVEHAVPAH